MAKRVGSRAQMWVLSGTVGAAWDSVQQDACAVVSGCGCSRRACMATNSNQIMRSPTLVLQPAFGLAQGRFGLRRGLAHPLLVGTLLLLGLVVLLQRLLPFSVHARWLGRSCIIR